jgi:hypothetical protein
VANLPRRWSKTKSGSGVKPATTAVGPYPKGPKTMARSRLTASRSKYLGKKRARWCLRTNISRPELLLQTKAPGIGVRMDGSDMLCCSPLLSSTKDVTVSPRLNQSSEGNGRKARPLVVASYCQVSSVMDDVGLLHGDSLVCCYVARRYLQDFLKEG